ncbi:signal transduction histidine kinase [Actinoplanes tereljensis]|uniref:sensor histidine kinase n=1 Tax=Paractinoplanes tereljensis TaxID=571912 RepID=UPI001EF34472|nr:histidine kinase [Actinoplanes tereljensis]
MNIRIASSAFLAVVLLAALGIEAVAIAASWGVRYWLVGGVAAVVVGGLALARHRHPRWTAVTALVVAGLTIAAARVFNLPTEPGPAMALALAVLVGSAVRTQPVRPAGGIAAGGLAVVVGAFLAARPHSSGASAAVALNIASYLGGVTIGLALRLLDERSAVATARVRQDERLELARELHDVVAHHIAGMLIQAQATHVLARRDPGRVGESLSGIEASAAEALRAMRRVVGVLRDDDDPPATSAGPEGLGDLVERFNRQGPPVVLHAGGADAAWPPEVSSTVYRIVRESLTNVARHAPHAGDVRVVVGEGPDGVTVEVADDAAHGPAPESRGGYGLVGMRERVESLGGTLHAGPRAEAGWSVRATLPVSRSS